MNRLLKYSLALGFALMAPAVASANVTVNLAGGFLYKSTGTSTADRLPGNSTVVLLIDANGNGFGDLTQAITSWTADPGDVVAARFGSSATAGRFSNVVSFDIAGTVGPNDKMMLVWYEKPFNASDVGPGANIKFGSYRTDSVINGSDFSFAVPSDGAIGALNIFSVARATALSLNDGIPEATLVASQTTAVPEPASLGIMALCGGALVMRRRRKA